jgi:hypothetical protein
MTESVQENLGLLALLDRRLDIIQAMKKEYDENVGEFMSQIDNPNPNPKEYVHALKRYKEYTQWPLFIAIHRVAIALIAWYTHHELSVEEYELYKNKLFMLIPKNNSNYTYMQYNMDPGNEQLLKSLKSLNANLNSAILLNDAVQKDAHNEQNEKVASRLSVLMGKGGGKKSRKPLRKNTRKSKSTKAVAAAIKDIPLSKARADFAALKAIHCDEINQAAKVGNAAMDHYFFRHRLAAKTKRAISYYDWIKTDWKRNEAELRLYKFNLAQGKTPEKARYGVFRLYYGAIHGFKPLVAKWMYCTYQPRIAVLDFSAGWGGRCLGAMALGIPYIGIDTNKDLRPAYERMVKELDEPKVTMRFQDAAATDFSRFKYDMVFTSPPYFKTVKPIEGYAHMPHYNDRADFNARFLFPVVRNTYAHLARGGTYALNIPADMYDEIRAAGILPPRLHEKHRLFLQPRFAKGNPKHPDTQYEEHIYVWKK